MNFLIETGGGKTRAGERFAGKKALEGFTKLPLKGWARVISMFFALFKKTLATPVRFVLEKAAKKSNFSSPWLPF